MAELEPTGRRRSADDREIPNATRCQRCIWFALGQTHKVAVSEMPPMAHRGSPAFSPSCRERPGGAAGGRTPGGSPPAHGPGSRTSPAEPSGCCPPTSRCGSGPISRRSAPSRVVREIERTFAAGCARPDFRLVHYSLQGNHAHLIVEAHDRDAPRARHDGDRRAARAGRERVADRSGRVCGRSLPRASPARRRRRCETPSATCA